MRPIIVTVLALLAPHLVHADDLLQTPPPSLQQQNDLHEAHMLEWVGLLTVATGVTLEVMSYTALEKQNQSCNAVFDAQIDLTLTTCTTSKSTNWGIMGLGLGTSGVGIIEMAIGEMKARHISAPQIQIGRGFVGLQQSFRF